MYSLINTTAPFFLQLNQNLTTNCDFLHRTNLRWRFRKNLVALSQNINFIFVFVHDWFRKECNDKKFGIRNWELVKSCGECLNFPSFSDWFKIVMVGKTSNKNCKICTCLEWKRMFLHNDYICTLFFCLQESICQDEIFCNDL